MIVICEQCQARYLVASLLLGANGRKVKCGVCSHIWYQPPVDEKYEAPQSFGDHLEHEILEPIPEGVRPIPEGSTVPSVKGEKFKFRFMDKVSKESMGGGAAAAAIFLIVFGGMVALHAPLVRAWPPFNLLFDTMGIETSLPGDGLIFSAVSAKAKQNADGKYALTLSGNILNLHKSAADVPAMVATLQKTGGVDSGMNFAVSSEKPSVGAEGTMPFTATYENLPDDMTDVTVKFAVK